MVDVEIYSLDTRMYNVIISTYCLRKRKDIIASDYSPLEPDWKKTTTISLPRDLRLSASWGVILTALLQRFVHHSIMVSRSLRIFLIVPPLC